MSPSAIREYTQVLPYAKVDFWSLFDHHPKTVLNCETVSCCLV